ncbi:flagellar protein FliS [Thalassotalea insulae]|uniref:Flagellar secretion chaperone FliS n=1 Tax=Thalassotalea insulae TaxID=2056778 RepID=A0ABQ6GQG2_9GAMM|nr:flagellar export chaperone FliS [Thalassotalea insulae]GLX77647.1 flagellar protein FliS [Thalassotalea insulae]
MRKNLQSYKQVDIKSSLLSADPHTVISMLFNGIFDALAIAKGSIDRKDYETKSVSISKAISILRSLQDSLDFESQPDISKNFNEFYEVCIDRLIDASTTLNVETIDEVVGLLRSVADAWRDIPQDAKEEGLEKLKQK